MLLRTRFKFIYGILHRKLCNMKENLFRSLGIPCLLRRIQLAVGARLIPDRIAELYFIFMTKH